MEAGANRAEEALDDALPVCRPRDDPASPRTGSTVEVRSSAVTATAHADGVVVVGMHDRDAKNMFSEALVSGLKQAFGHIEPMPAYKVVVLTGLRQLLRRPAARSETLLAIHEGRARFTDEKRVPAGRWTARCR